MMNICYTKHSRAKLTENEAIKTHLVDMPSFSNTHNAFAMHLRINICVWFTFKVLTTTLT